MGGIGRVIKHFPWGWVRQTGRRTTYSPGVREDEHRVLTLGFLTAAISQWPENRRWQAAGKQNTIRDLLPVFFFACTRHGCLRGVWQMVCDRTWLFVWCVTGFQGTRGIMFLYLQDVNKLVGGKTCCCRLAVPYLNTFLTWLTSKYNTSPVAYLEIHKGHLLDDERAGANGCLSVI